MKHVLLLYILPFTFLSSLILILDYMLFEGGTCHLVFCEVLYTPRLCISGTLTVWVTKSHKHHTPKEPHKYCMPVHLPIKHMH